MKERLVRVAKLLAFPAFYAFSLMLFGYLTFPYGRLKDRIIAEGMLPMDNPSIAELQDFVKSEIVRWSKVVQQAGIAGSQ